MFCEPNHSKNQALTPKCVISRRPLWELSQSGERAGDAAKGPLASHSFSATWKAVFGATAPRRRLLPCL